MQKNDLIRLAAEFVENSPLNYLTSEQAIHPDLIGLRLYDEPLLGFAAADDALFAELRRPGIIGEHFCLPPEWLRSAQTVISFFLPLTSAVRKANRLDATWPASEWLHGRIEGQLLVNALAIYLRDSLINAGYPSVSPSLDGRFWSSSSPNAVLKHGVLRSGFTSNWSERHAAHICGLGTFGLSAGLITKKGMAGRFSSVITSLALPADTRPYQTYNEYCTRCGACVRRCPVRAISLEQGKNHEICGAFVDKTREIYDPRYGCGKCQVAVPCENRIPPRKQKEGTTTPEFEGAIFDLDGTLLDSMNVWKQIDIAFLGKRSLEATADYVEAVTPLGFQKAAEYTIQRFNLNETVEDIIGEWTEMCRHAYHHTIGLKPGARAYLQRLKQSGVKLAVATALTPELFEPALKNNGIYDLFDAFAFVNEVERGKGFPDIYLLAARRMQAAPENCIVFEDIAAGITGAKIGGFLTCGVYDSYCDHEWAKIKATADRTILGFEELLR